MKDILYEETLVAYLKVVSDPWENTPLAGYYFKSSKQKGVYGEMVVAAAAKEYGYHVAKRTNSGHDCIIKNIKAEVKFSVLSTGGGYMFNHIAKGKDWSRIIFAAIDRTLSPRIVYLEKDDLISMIDNGKYFVRQQGGKLGGNDDWLFVAHNDRWVQFVSELAVKDFSTW